MSLKSWSRSHRIAATWVVALLAANGGVLATGLADAVDRVIEQAEPRTITLITGPDGRQIAVDPNTPAGWKAIADAEERGDAVSTVAVPPEAVPAKDGKDGKDGAPAVSIPGVSPTDLQDLLTGTVDQITTTVRTIIDSTGQTVVSIVGDAGTTASSIVDTATSTVSSIVDTVTTLPVTVPTVPVTVPTTIPITVPTTLPVTVPTTVPVTVPTTVPLQDTVTTIENTVTTLETTVTSIVGGLPGL